VTVVEDARAGADGAAPSALTQLRGVGITDPGLLGALAEGLAGVEERLATAVAMPDGLADATARHLLEAGGKRTRPLLCLLAAQLGRPAPEVLDAAVVVELTHLATLYHDDVMDSADVRRGVPAAHAVWGNTVAILSGDLLFARASRVCAGLGPKAVTIQAETFERLCLGQMHETVGPGDVDPVAHYLQVLSDKTGSLIATACRFGAMFAGCEAATVETMVRYGERVGCAFQLADDVLDLVSDAADSGKVPGTDLREGVATLPVLILRTMAAVGEAGPEGERALQLIDAGVESDADLDEALGLLRGHPAMAAARQAARQAADDAVAALDGLPVGPVREALAAVARRLADRVA
jgi:heptaprenyl diphosphate synthase